MDRYDVLVVGAGLAGLQCAARLGQQGLRVLLIDRRADVTQGIRTTGIFVRRTLADFPPPEDCLGPAIHHVTLYSPAGRRLALSSPHPEFRIGRMGALYAYELRQAQARGVVWCPDTRYVAAAPASVGCHVQLATGRQMWEIMCRILIGADSAGSGVARDLGLDRNERLMIGVEDVFDGVPLDGPPTLHCHLDPRLAPGYLAWAAHDGDELHIGVGGDPSRFRPMDALADFRRRLATRFDFSRARRRENRAGRIPVGGILTRIGNRQGLLVGDAAGAVSPLTAGGLDPCYRLSALACEIIIEALRRDKPEMLAAYSGSLFRPRFVSRLWMRQLIDRLDSPFAMEWACQLLRLPGMQLFARHIFFGRGSFPDVSAAQALAAHRVIPRMCFL